MIPDAGMPWIFCGSQNTVLGREFRVAKPYIGQCILLMSPYVGCSLWIICLYYFFYCLVNDDLYLLTTWLPVHGLFFMVDCVWLCCLTYVIVWMSRVKASFKCWSILITNLGKQSSFSPSVSFLLCVCVFVLLHWWFLFSWYLFFHCFFK